MQILAADTIGRPYIYEPELYLSVLTLFMYVHTSYISLVRTHLLYVLKICTKSEIMQITVFFLNKILHIFNLKKNSIQEGNCIEFTASTASKNSNLHHNIYIYSFRMSHIYNIRIYLRLMGWH